MCAYRVYYRIVVLCLIAVIGQSVPSSEEPRQPDIHQVFTFTTSQKHDQKKYKKVSSTSTGSFCVVQIYPDYILVRRFRPYITIFTWPNPFYSSLVA